MISDGKEMIWNGHRLVFKYSCGACFFKDKDECPDCVEGIWVEENPSPWHTGTPTEEGYYLIHLGKYYCKDTVGYMVAKWERNGWRTINIGSYWNLEEEIDAWQKITPYEEN